MSESLSDHIYLGIDVGTGSARAGLFDTTGRMLGVGTRAITMWRPESGYAEQSSQNIWESVCAAVAEAMQSGGVNPASVRGVGFDATCSLVLLDAEDRPVTASPSGDDDQNVIVWMDHRAMDQTARINAGHHEVLKYVGGTISPEMETPKLLWLKEKMPNSWNRTARFFDLPDFLVYRATGCDVRSLCSTVCKWTYLGHKDEGGWDDEYFRSIGLGDLADESFARIGKQVRPMGESVGTGLTDQAAKELGLTAGTPVSVSIIDAHAGGLGLLGAEVDGIAATMESLDTRLALIGGTSTCHMAVSPEARFIEGVWGPYYSAMVPGMWLTEGGQSATGALIDHVIFSHARAAELRSEAKANGRTVYDLLNQRLDQMGSKARFAAELTKQLHVLPYFHGNRSPRADASLRGVVSGLTLSDTVDDLALLYLATVQAVAHGTKHIIDSLNEKGYNISMLFACGGGTKNPVFIREHADITQCQIVLPREPEAVLLGSAILGAVAAGDFDSVVDAMAALNKAGETVQPNGGEVAAYHHAKHAIFHRMYDQFTELRTMMDKA